MKAIYKLQHIACWLALFSFCLPRFAPAQQPAQQPPARPIVGDVALRHVAAGGPKGQDVLIGRVVNRNGAALAGVSVELISGKQSLAVSKTDPQGYFAFRGLRGGVYRLTSERGQGVFRVWPQKAAPPVAQPGALVVAGTQTVRGQDDDQDWVEPLIIGTLIAASIAIPVALLDRNGRRLPGSG